MDIHTRAGTDKSMDIIRIAYGAHTVLRLRFRPYWILRHMGTDRHGLGCITDKVIINIIVNHYRAATIVAFSAGRGSSLAISSFLSSHTYDHSVWFLGRHCLSVLACFIHPLAVMIAHFQRIFSFISFDSCSFLDIISDFYSYA